jgi:predicted dehydrogenase
LDVQEDQLKAMASPSGIFDENYGREPEDMWGFVENLEESGEIKRSKYVSLSAWILRNWSQLQLCFCRWPSTENGAYVELFKNLAGVIRGTAERVVKWEEVVATLEVIEAAHQSSREGRTIDLL